MDVTPSMQFDAPKGCSFHTDDIEALTAASWGEEGEGGGAEGGGDVGCGGGGDGGDGGGVGGGTGGGVGGSPADREHADDCDSATDPA